jgi:hypothetical protein
MRRDTIRHSQLMDGDLLSEIVLVGAGFLIWVPLLLLVLSKIR